MKLIFALLLICASLLEVALQSTAEEASEHLCKRAEFFHKNLRFRLAG